MYERITDLQKFELLSHACLLLFPSYFEGYGYPLVEAAYMGVPGVAYDLPVIRETVGDAAIYAAIGDHQAFSRAIESALSRQPGPVIRDQLRINPGTLTAGLRLARILQRQLRRVSPISRAPLPRTLSVPTRTAVLADPLVRADWDAIGHPARLKDLRAVLAPGLLTVAGTVLTEENATISVRMSGVEPITQVVSGTNANTTHEFTLQLSAGPLANLDQVCTVILAENNKTVTSIPISPSITLDLLFRADAWAGCADMRPVSRDAGHVVIVASLDRLLILEDDTVAIAELSAVFSRMGYVVELIVRTDDPSPRSFPMLDVDMLPLADTVVIVPQNYRPTGYSWSNPFVKAAAVIVLAENEDNETFATPMIRVKFKSLENVCLTVSAVESSDTVESTNIEYLPTIPLVSRSEARRANRRLLILLREAARIDDDTLTRLIRDVFPTVAARFGLIRVLIDHGIAARPAFTEEQLPVGWTVQSANYGTMIATMREAGTTVIINYASKSSSRKLLAIGSEFDAKIIEASDSTSSLTIADMLVELFAGTCLATAS